MTAGPDRFEIFNCRNCGTFAPLPCVDRACHLAEERDALIEIARLRATGTMDERQRLVIAAAAAATEAAAELLEIGRHTDPLDASHFDRPELVERLADACKLTIEARAARFGDEAYDSEINQLHGALAKYLEGWAG